MEIVFYLFSYNSLIMSSTTTSSHTVQSSLSVAIEKLDDVLSSVKYSKRILELEVELDEVSKKRQKLESKIKKPIPVWIITTNTDNKEYIEKKEWPCGISQVFLMVPVRELKGYENKLDELIPPSLFKSWEEDYFSTSCHDIDPKEFSVVGHRNIDPANIRSGLLE